MNRIGHMFAIGLVLITIVLCSTMLYSFTKSSTPIKISMDYSSLQDVYIREAKFNFFLKDSAALAAQQALFETARKGAVSGTYCKAYGNDPAYVIWNDNCNPIVLNTNVLFSQYFTPSFEDFIKSYPDSLNQSKFSVAVESSSSKINRVKLTSDNLTIKKVAENNAILSYSAEYSYNPSFVYDFELGPQDFRNVYNLVNLTMIECKKANSDAEIIASCMNSLQITRKWSNLAIKGSMDSKDYVLFRMSSFKKFFFQDSFDSKFKWQNVELKFAIEI